MYWFSLVFGPSSAGRPCKAQGPMAYCICHVATGTSFTHLFSDGYCDAGYYTGNPTPEATLESCKALCASEAQCMYLALVAGKICSRYNSGAGNCDKTGNGHETYKKNLGASHLHVCVHATPPPPPPPPPPWTRCRPIMAPCPGEGGGGRREGQSWRLQAHPSRYRVDMPW